MPPPPGLSVPAGSDIARRFAVHRNNVVASLVDALASAFPVTRALVGDTFFRAMARERVLADPPRSPLLSGYGDGLAAFIGGFTPAASVPYLADVARLEQLRIDAFNAADAIPVDIAAFAALAADAEQLAVTAIGLHPSARWMRSRHAVLSIWQAHQSHEDMRDTDLAGIKLDRAEDVLVTRDSELQLHCRSLPAGGVALLDALRDGQPLGVAVAAALADDDAADIATLLALLMHESLVVELIRPSVPPPEH
jgi:hypothetical protein